MALTALSLGIPEIRRRILFQRSVKTQTLWVLVRRFMLVGSKYAQEVGGDRPRSFGRQVELEVNSGWVELAARHRPLSSLSSNKSGDHLKSSCLPEKPLSDCTTEPSC
ncbi:hypothetical protein HGRIS_011560 [Hohenbuehelia grisea]|uniref:Uncharacterized protein n=1 Tax=Hohenbuehelia grisea TaxID=104357 RepID=A0ABR3JVN7_9AGAR